MGSTPHPPDGDLPSSSTCSSLRLTPDEGIVFEGPDGLPRLHAGGVFALDVLKYDPRNNRDSGVRIDRAVARLDGSIAEDWRFRLAADLKGTDTRYGLEEAWLYYEPKSWLRATAGLIEIPLGYEYSVQEEDLPFVGYGYPSLLDGVTDLALRLDGEIHPSIFYYDLVAAAGEGFDLFGQKRDSPQLSARIVSYPFSGSDTSVSFFHYDIPLLSGLFAGAAFAYLPDFRGNLDIATPLRNKLFVTPDLRAEEGYFIHYTAGSDMGPFRITYELVEGSLVGLETPQGKKSLRGQIGSWEATASWLLTGEIYDSRPFRIREGGARVHPARPLWGGPAHKRGPGAFELAIRYTNADMDRDFFRFGVTNYVQSSQEFRTFTGALNWYATSSFRVTVEFTRTIADQGPAAFSGRNRDTSFVLRLQYAF